MKKIKIVLIIFVVFSFTGLNTAIGQWTTSGNNIYNTNSGNVGIGNNAPSTLLYVAKNMSEPTITVRNTGGFGGATYVMQDDASGANWKFKATLTGGFKIRDHANLMDVIVIEPNSFANAIYIKTTDNIGMGTASPNSSALLDMTSTTKGFLPPRMTNAEMNALQNPVSGLMVFCTDCSSDGGRIALYLGGSWNTLSINNCTTPQSTPPSEGTHVPSQSQIIWSWNAAAGATGYKWNISDDYSTALDMGISLTKTETGLTCETPYTRYVWAYNGCGNSTVVPLTSTTTACWECGNPITVSHVAGNIAPVDKTVTYGTVNNIPGETSKCWITSNLGADNQANAVNDVTEAAAGWYWQFNRQQGYKHDGVFRTPNTTWITSISENSDWLTVNDPCALLLGTGWRLPTSTEWSNVDAAGGWGNWNVPWSSPLKLHAAGFLSTSSGLLNNIGVEGNYWSSSYNNSSSGYALYFVASQCFISSVKSKVSGFSSRCLRD